MAVCNPAARVVGARGGLRSSGAALDVIAGQDSGVQGTTYSKFTGIYWGNPVGWRQLLRTDCSYGRWRDATCINLLQRTDDPFPVRELTRAGSGLWGPCACPCFNPRSAGRRAASLVQRRGSMDGDGRPAAQSC